MEKRLARKTAATKALEEKVRTLETQLQSVPKQVADDEPTLEQFQTFDEFEKAVIEYKANKLAEQRLKETKQKELQELQTRKMQEQKRDFETKESKFRERQPDYDDVVARASEALGDLKQRGAKVEALTNAILEFDNAPEMLYHVGKDDGVLEDLVQLSPIGIMRELVKMEMALQPVAKTEQKPPEPIKSTSGRGGGKPLSLRGGKDILDWVNS
jgi:myosin heavy subunit